ncbi:MAG: hypothetical protein NXH95_06245 [Pseudomonadaceae bacterium]|jgi:hypothetical protein|nr:hypothetical protein [Pseudomonadaceae bacterium]
MKLLLPIAVVLLMTSCIQENNPRNLRMGDVTLGQQLIDLKLAFEADAVTESEYETIKANLVNAASMCEAAEQEDDSWFF